MAEFCNKCAEKYGMKPDINVIGIIARLRKGRIIKTEICEGCGMISLRKNENRIVQVMRIRKPD